MDTESINITKLDSEDMVSFPATAKTWGSSLGVVIPADIVAQEKIKAGSKLVVLVLPERKSRKPFFGILKGKIHESTDKIMRDMDRGWR